MKTISRADARGLGLTRFFIEKPCPQGHVAPRRVSTGGCVKCAAEQQARRWREDPKAREQDKENYRRRRVRVLARRAAQYVADPEKYKARRREQYKKHHAYFIDYAKRYREENKERLTLEWAEYAKRRPEIYRDSARRRRALKAASSGHFTNEEWLALCAKYGDACACCRKKKPLAADHVVPLSVGGTNLIDNIQPLCKPCNSRKSTKTVRYEVHV